MINQSIEQLLDDVPAGGIRPLHKSRGAPMNSWEWFAVSYGVAMLVLARAILKSEDGKRTSAGRRGLGIALIVVAVAVPAFICGKTVHDHTLETNQANAQLRNFLPGARIVSLSTSTETITYVIPQNGANNYDVCTTKLYRFGNSYLVATIGAQCAPFQVTYPNNPAG